MATSSIVTNVKITDSKKGKAFVKAWIASANEPKVDLSAPLFLPSPTWMKFAR